MLCNVCSQNPKLYYGYCVRIINVIPSLFNVLVMVLFIYRTGLLTLTWKYQILNIIIIMFRRSVETAQKKYPKVDIVKSSKENGRYLEFSPNFYAFSNFFSFFCVFLFNFQSNQICFYKCSDASWEDSL